MSSSLCRDVVYSAARGRRYAFVVGLGVICFFTAVSQLAAATRPAPGPFVLQVTPANFSLTPGAMLQFSASRAFFRSAGSQPAKTEDITHKVRWSSSDVSKATVDAATGFVTAGSTLGPVTITAANGPLSASVQLTISASVTLNSITVTPASPAISNGSTQQFMATGHFSDSSMLDLTASATWSSSNAHAATIVPGGLATAVGVGSTTIQAASGLITGSTTLTVTPSSQTTPQLVQHVSGTNSRTTFFSSPFCYYDPLPGFTTAGNTVVVGFTFASNATPTVIDDKGNSYSMVANFFDSTDTQSIAVFAAFNVAAGARLISLCFDSDPGGFVQPVATEFDNVTGLDVASKGSQGNGTSLSAGTLTPATSGDLLYQVAYSLNTNQNQASFASATQSNIQWNLLSADLMDGFTSQYGVYNSTNAINPGMTMGTSGKWISIAVAFKTGSKGSVPAGMRIVHLHHENIPTHQDAGGTGNPFPNPLTLQFPCSGNLEVALMGGGNPANFISSISDSNANTWTQAGSNVTQGDTDVQTFYAGNAICSGSLAMNVHWTSTNGDQTIMFYDVAGASTSPLDTTMSGTGNQSSIGNLTVFSITPGTSSTEMIFTLMPVDFNTVTGLIGGLNDADILSGESLSGPEPVDENNGWGHFVVNSKSAVPVTWTFISTATSAGAWSSMATAFK